MPPILNTKAEDLDSKEKRSQFLACVLGCGQKGVLFAVSLANAGFKVVCWDADASVVKKLVKGKTKCSQALEGNLKSLIAQGQLSVSNEFKKTVSKSDIAIITVPAKVNDKKKIDYSEAINICKQVGASLHTGALVVYGDIVDFGFTESTAKETLENTSGLKAGVDFGLAYIPIDNSMANCGLIAAGVGKMSVDAAVNLAKTLSPNVKAINDVKTAELATLFQFAKKDVDRALANELTVFCENANIDYFELLKVLSTEEKNFWPSTVEEENRNYTYLLLENADNLNVKMRLPALSRQINEGIVKHAVNLTQDALRSCGKSLRRARVTVFGPLNPSNAAAVFVKTLELKGAKVNIYNPALKRETSDAITAKSNLTEAVEGADCIVILSDEEPFISLNLKKIKALTRTPSAVIDLAGAYDPGKVGAEGFIYRGLGRGT